MPTVAVLNMAGKEVEKIELAEGVFGIEPNVSVMNDMVKAYLANQRQGTQSTLTRTEVRGGGKKPWAQKHTGRARAGNINTEPAVSLRPLKGDGCQADARLPLLDRGIARGHNLQA